MSVGLLIEESARKKSLRAKWLREIDEKSHEFRREALSSTKDKDLKQSSNDIPEDDAALLSKINPYSTLRIIRKNNKQKLRSLPDNASNDSENESSSEDSDSPRKMGGSGSRSTTPVRKSSTYRLQPPSMAVIKIGKPKRKSPKQSSLEDSKKSRSRSSTPSKSRPRTDKVNAVGLFMESYIKACKDMKIETKRDVLDILEYNAKKKLSILEMDLSYLRLKSADIDALSASFSATYKKLAEIPPTGSNQVNVIEPIDINLKSNDIDDGVCIGALLISISSVVSLNLSNNKMGPLASSNLAKSIYGYKFLNEITLCGNNIGSKSAIELMAVFTRHKVLERIDLGENDLDDSIVDSVVTLIKECPLVFLSLRFNKIGPKGMKKIIEAVQVKPSLVEVDFTDTGMGSGGKQFVEDSSNNFMRRMCIGLNDYPSSFPVKFASYLQKMKSLEVLDIRFMNIAPKAMRLILQSITSASLDTLRELILSGNLIDDKSEEILSEFIRKTRVLETLCVRACGMSFKAVSNLCNALEDNKSVKAIELSGNSVKHKNAIASVCNMIRFNSTIKVLSLMGSKIDRRTIGTIGLALQSNKRIQKLYLDGNRIGDRGVMHFSAILTGNQALRVLSLKATKISLKGFTKAVEEFEKSGVELVDLRDNGISPGHANRLPLHKIFVKLC